MSLSYPKEHQVDVRQDRGLVGAEQPPAVQESGLPPSYSQSTAYPGPQSYPGYDQGGTYPAAPPTYNITQTPIPVVHPVQPPAGVVEVSRTRVVVLRPDQEAVNRRFRIRCAIWGTVIGVKVLVAIIVVAVIFGSN